MTTPEQPEWVTEIPSGPVHPGRQQAERPTSAQHMFAFGSQMIEQFLRRVVQAVVGIFIPGGGSAFNQLASWANGINSGLQDFATLFTGIDFSQTPGEVWADVIDVFVSPLEKFAELVGGFVSAFRIPILDPTKILNLPGLFADVTAGFKGAFDKWFGGTSGTGTVAEFEYVIESIRDAVINGYLVTAFTSDAVAWPVASAVDWNAALIGGGQNATGGTGGLHGSFIARPLDMAGVTAIDVQIGTAGNLTTIRVAATPPHTGAILAQSAPHGTSGGVALQGGLYGLSPTNSLPGSGGDGGSGGPGGTEATPGENSALATGGARGAAGNFGANGQPGGSVSAGSQIKCGGAGGGGGGRANVVLNGGGDGGAGGYPGGGGGGRGAGWGGGPNGLLGPGAPGVAFVMRKGAA